MTFVDYPEEAKDSKQSVKPDSRPTNDAKATSDSEAQWGYDLYPERRQKLSKSLTDIVVGKAGREEYRKIECERNVYKCITKSPLVRLMVGALKASGCPIDIRRHISCEECAPNVSGGYDPVMNQVVVCHNNASKEGIINAVLIHEMVHMFDYCRNNLNFKNLDHLACTEIRAANLAHCSFMSSWVNGDSTFFNFKKTHQNCVKSKALSSMMAVRNITQDEAIDAIERVFTRCYNDLEPIGRRIRRNSGDMKKAFQESYYYGYDDGLK